jgi:Tol biopolymer transport system component
MRTIRTSACLVLLAGALALVGPASHASAGTTGKNGTIVFTGSSRSGGQVHTDIWSVGAGGGGLYNITKNDGMNDSEATWSPEGGPHVAFIGSKPGPPGKLQPGDLYWMTPRQTHTQRLTKTATFDERSPAWHPDGGRIAMSRAPFRGGVDGTADIFTIRLYGSRLMDRTPGTPNSDDIQPAWSPDGLLIAFASDRGGTYGIYTMSPLGKNVTEVTSDGTQPNWSPDGKKLVFVRGNDIWVINANGSHPTKLTTHPGSKVDANPNFTPDRTRIIFQRGTDISSVDLKGKHLERIATRSVSSADPDMQPACNFSGTPGHDVIVGTPGPDLICYSAGGDTIYGKGGNDVIFGGLGGDTIYGGPGNDLIQSGGNHSIKGDRFFGQGGNDFLTGSPLNDYIVGGKGADRVYGWTGSDVLKVKDGVQGNDIVDGGIGDHDTCVADPRDQVDECP